MKIYCHALRILFTAAVVQAVLWMAPSVATAQQTLYVVDNNSNVYKITPDGTKTAFGPSVGNAGPLALDAAGNLYVGYASSSGYGGE